MRAVQLALLIMSIQFGLGFVQIFGGFGNIPYEQTITHVEIIKQGNVQTAQEQSHLSFSIMSSIRNILLWDWIKNLVQPWYTQDTGIKALIDFIIDALRALTTIIYGAAIIEFIANRVNVLR